MSWYCEVFQKYTMHGKDSMCKQCQNNPKNKGGMKDGNQIKHVSSVVGKGARR